MYIKRIEELRVDNDISQKEICSILKIKQPQYSRYEKGTEPRIEYLIKLAIFYNTSIDYIVGLTNSIKSYPRAKFYEKK